MEQEWVREKEWNLAGGLVSGSDTERGAELEAASAIPRAAVSATKSEQSMARGSARAWEKERAGATAETSERGSESAMEHEWAAEWAAASVHQRAAGSAKKLGRASASGTVTASATHSEEASARG